MSQPASHFQEFVRFFTSLKLTVALLTLSIVLVLFATLDQVHLGIWAVQEKWFRSFIVLHDIKGIPVPVFPGGYFIGGLLLLNLIAAHVHRFKFTLKKSGILITHAGLILLLLGELFTGIAQEEFQMRLDEGETKNYSESARDVEFAVIDATAPDTDTVTSIPAGLVARAQGRVIQHPSLPFTLGIRQYHPNSALQMRDPAAGGDSQSAQLPPSGATRDIGTRLALLPQPLTYKENARNLPSALVELRGPQGTLGVWLLSAWLIEPQTFEYEGRTWRLHMRFKREYHPWSLTLIDFRHDTYIGTDIPKNFSSHLRLFDPARGDDREVLIYMNNPLRHDGLTLYQQGYDNNDRTTILQVVRNPGWMIPYISCAMLSAGLLIQFGIHLVAFARRRAADDRERRTLDTGPRTPGKQSSPPKPGLWPLASGLRLLVPALALLLGLAWLGSTLRPLPPQNGYDLSALGRLPVVKNGRIKPLDTVARTTLLQLQGRQRVALPAPVIPGALAAGADTRRSIPPIEWLANLVFDSARADTFQTFEITHPELLALMHVTTDDGDGGKRYSFRQLEPRLPDLERQIQLARDIEAKQRTPFQHAAVQFHGNVTLYQQIKYSLVDPASPDWLSALTGLQQNLAAGIAAVRAQVNKEPHDEQAARRVLDITRRFQLMAEYGNLLAIPPATPAGASQIPSADGDDDRRFVWKKTGAALLDIFNTGQLDPSALTWAGLGHAWRAQQPGQFNTILRLYREALDTRYSPELRKSDIETRFNSAAPFYTSAVLYVIAFLFAVISWLRWPRALGRAAFLLALLAWLVSTAGIAIRMWLEGRPPVTNLYSSAVFIGWGSVFLCLVLEWFYGQSPSRSRAASAIGTAVAGLIGFSTLVIAHYLSLSGDTLEMMRAVLDSNFWLATHVIVVTIGYSATFVAGGLAALHVLLALRPRLLPPPLAQNLAGMVYGIVCFATLFSMVGTILGGIWADQSWGRFWGWDPKENGALMIVLWNAVILHARWGGLVRQRGFMNLALVGNIITGWSWFGTNLLGVGLHSYGFTEKGAVALGLFFLSQLLLIGLSFVPSAKPGAPVRPPNNAPKPA